VGNAISPIVARHPTEVALERSVDRDRDRDRDRGLATAATHVSDLSALRRNAGQRFGALVRLSGDLGNEDNRGNPKYGNPDTHQREKLVSPNSIATGVRSRPSGTEVMRRLAAGVKRR
jgi:hypothetical protein